MDIDYDYHEFLPQLGGRKHTFPFTGLIPIEEGAHYKFERNSREITFEKELDFKNTPLESCAAFIIRTREPAPHIIERASTDGPEESLEWADRSVTFSVGTFHLGEDVELTASAVRPDLVLFLLHRVQTSFD